MNLLRWLTLAGAQKKMTKALSQSGYGGASSKYGGFGRVTGNIAGKVACRRTRTQRRKDRRRGGF